MKTSLLPLTALLLSGSILAQTNWEYEADPLDLFNQYSLSGPMMFFLSQHPFCDDALTSFIPQRPETELYGCSTQAVAAVKAIEAADRYNWGYLSMARDRAGDQRQLKKFAQQNRLNLEQLNLALTCSQTTSSLQRAAYGLCREGGMAERKVNFSNITKDGSGWVMESVTKAPVLKGLVQGESDEVQTKISLQLVECDGQEIAPEQNLEAPLPELISQLEDINFENFWQCTLRAIPNTFILKHADFYNSRSLSDRYGYAKAKALTVRVQSNGKVSMIGSFPGDSRYSRGIELKAEYLPRSQSGADASSRERALEASKNFLTLIKEHGKTITRAATAGMSQGEIRRLAAESLAIRKSAILRELSTLNGNYGHLTFIDKLSISISVRRAYRYFQGIEARIGKIVNDQERLNLDGMINPPRYSTPTNPIHSTDSNG